MIIQFLLLVFGLVLLIKGADWLVDGASALAKRYKISDLAIGLTIVAFGTSAPELVVNVFAASQGHADIVFGNVIGSNNFNLFIILGISGLIAPLIVQSSSVWKEIPLSGGAAVIFFILANDLMSDEAASVSRLDGFILLVCFGLFIWYVYTQLRRDENAPDTHVKNYTTWKTWLLILVGLGGLIWGGKLVVSNALQIATTFGISEKIIGLTIVAAGTSLPELATSLVAALKKKNDIAVGNIIGSNIFNIFLVLGTSSMIRPLPYNITFDTDLYILAGGTLFLFLAMLNGKPHKLTRWEAGILFVFYASYTVYLVVSQ